MNSSNNTVEGVYVAPKYLIPTFQYYVIGTGLLFVVTFGPFMNMTSLVVFAKNKHLQSPTNIFVISLLLGDLGMSFGAFISMTANFNRYYFWGDGVCVFEGFWLYLMGLTNLYSHAGIAYDRYIVIAKPLNSKHITARVAVAAVLVIWFQGFCWASFPHFGWGKYTYEPARTSCAVEWDSNELNSASYNVAITIWSLALPLAVIIFSYHKVMVTIRNITRNNVWNMGSRIARKNLRIEKKMFKTMALMLASYAWSWTPYTVVSVWAVVGEASDIPVYIITIPAVVAKSACIWDPIIYLWTNRQFRKAFYNTIPCKSLGRMMIQREERQNKEKDDSLDEVTGRRNKTVPRLSLEKTVVEPIGASKEGGTHQRGATGGVSHIQVPPVVVSGPSGPSTTSGML